MTRSAWRRRAKVIGLLLCLMLLGVRLYLGFRPPSKTLSWSFHIPVWLLVVGVALPIGILLWLWPDRRTKAGFCKTCKYDLTGNVSGVCPECGTAISLRVNQDQARTEVESRNG